jgi:N-acetylglucosaminyldiphosphoundecaprenol N-acetyl-beta-D-mannosaminyltransferase
MTLLAEPLASPIPEPELPALPAPRRVQVLGARFAAVSTDEAVARMIDSAVTGAGSWTVTANLDHLRRFTSDAATQELLGQADLVVADGMPIVWASRVAGAPLPERVAGSDMIWMLSRAAAQRGVSLFLLGGEPGTAEAAARVLRAHAPGLHVAGTWCPPHGFERSDAELRAMERAVVGARPGIVLVALGFPKQDVVIAQLRERLPGTAFMGVGITLGFVAGEVRRAPRWAQALGVEWLHRLVQEPRRLWRRYLLHGLPFAARLFAAAAVARASAHLPAGAFGGGDGD